MPATATWLGGAMGMGVAFYSNAVRKLPLMRNPWEHAIGLGLGAYAGAYVAEWEERTQKEVAALEEVRAKKFAAAGAK